MKTYNIILDGQVIGTETVLQSMSPSAVRLLMKHLGYPEGFRVKKI